MGLSRPGILGKKYSGPAPPSSPVARASSEANDDALVYWLLVDTPAKIAWRRRGGISGGESASETPGRASAPTGAACSRPTSLPAPIGAHLQRTPTVCVNAPLTFH
ncbi:hypothetical protein WA026_004720 [Henosepilachna vigintioctopunctata]|uniref:Uncharacterized protein n=1 Tax=Henosepilachna vigintioctopunctata TaxID=420089 RepID=A0AAW1V190_9CUCU